MPETELHKGYEWRLRNGVSEAHHCYYFCILGDVSLNYHPIKFGSNCKTQCGYTDKTGPPTPLFGEGLNFKKKGTKWKWGSSGVLSPPAGGPAKLLTGDEKLVSSLRMDLDGESLVERNYSKTLLALRIHTPNA